MVRVATVPQAPTNAEGEGPFRGAAFEHLDGVANARPAARGKLLLIAIAGAVLAPVGRAVLLKIGLRGPGLVWALAGLVSAASVVLVILYDRWGQRRKAGAIARAFLEVGYCPSCRYRLAGLAAAADGCTVCPECGAAWRVPAG